MFLLLWVVAVSSMVVVIVGYGYYKKESWQMKFLTVRLNHMIRNPQRKKKNVQHLLKDLYSLLNRKIDQKDSATAYQIIDLLKLAYGYGLIREDEAVRLMAVTVSALNNGSPDTAGFILDAFRPLIRQLSPQYIPSVAEQLTLIGAIALKQKQSFLVAKVTECIFVILDRTDTHLDNKILISTIHAFKVIGVFGLRHRDIALFREITGRLSSWFSMNRVTEDVAEEIVYMLTAWLHRIVGMSDIALFDLIEECVYSLLEGKILSGNAMELLVDEWGNLAASACLHPNSPVAGRIITFLFICVDREEGNQYWQKVVAIAGRVAKLAVSRHGITVAFRVFYPMLEMGRRMLSSELRFVQYVDEYKQEVLFAIVRECLIVIAFASRQELVGSLGTSIVEVFNCWMGSVEITSNRKSVKKYCQLLLLFWLKDKRQAKRHMPNNSELTEPILFSDRERHRLGI